MERCRKLAPPLEIPASISETQRPARSNLTRFLGSHLCAQNHSSVRARPRGRTFTFWLPQDRPMRRPPSVARLAKRGRVAERAGVIPDRRDSCGGNIRDAFHRRLGAQEDPVPPSPGRPKRPERRWRSVVRTRDRAAATGSGEALVIAAAGRKRRASPTPPWAQSGDMTCRPGGARHVSHKSRAGPHAEAKGPATMAGCT